MSRKCVVINAKLSTEKCPLSAGSCSWRHRKHATCMYSTEFDNNPPSPQVIAALVGESIPSEDAVARITERIKTTFRRKTSS